MCIQQAVRCRAFTSARANPIFPIDIRSAECEVVIKFLLSYANTTWLLIVSNMAVDLTPLDPESHHVREVYAHYGLAMYWAQCLEQSIFQHLLFFDHFPRAVKTYTTAEDWVAAIDRYEARELKQTMGRLIYRLREAGQTTSSIEQLLDRALKNRNGWLMPIFLIALSISCLLAVGIECLMSLVLSKIILCAPQTRSTRSRCRWLRAMA